MKFENLDIEIKEVQDIQLEILVEFDRICRKHNINYQLFAGTLLGCIRHKGFIPWDDDIDISLMREDYNRFVEICKIELDSKFFMQTYDTDKNYFKQSGKLRKNDTICLQDTYKEFDMHHGISISLMPLDNIKPGTLSGFFHRKFFQFLFFSLIKLDGSRSFKRCIGRKSYLERALRINLFFMSKLISKSWTDKFQTRVAGMFNNKETKYVTHLTNGASKKRYRAYMIKKDDFNKRIEGEFEEMYFPIPHNYDQVLSNLYGEYMKLPPGDQQKPHHGVIEINLDTKKN
ncbi:LicD family protein [Sutcliffiella halmapala]|uniref:LicD family protein n=1 Tax=Sutcliffiella halmapala TaxID=79882 RepID=UPI00147585EE|nr:LicD family protein [Sutcliffiella halmapala]